MKELFIFRKIAKFALLVLLVGFLTLPIGREIVAQREGSLLEFPEQSRAFLSVWCEDSCGFSKDVLDAQIEPPDWSDSAPKRVYEPLYFALDEKQLSYLRHVRVCDWSHIPQSTLPEGGVVTFTKTESLHFIFANEGTPIENVLWGQVYFQQKGEFRNNCSWLSGWYLWRFFKNLS